MASEYRAIGKDGYVSFQGEQVSADYRNLEMALTGEKSAGSKASESYILKYISKGSLPA